MKFRVFDTQEKVMIDWVTIFQRAFNNGDKSILYDIFIDPNRFKILHFTGRMDKDGNDIYDGDILKGFPHATVSVFFDDYAAAFCTLHKTWQEYCNGEMREQEHTNLLCTDLDDCGDSWVVVGNIYQNEKLILNELNLEP